ncbi:MAG: TetR/AcrR family transcriptional regulator [Eubacterium sp.]|nr:TetR/AcrR family transcriptional regulator [Bacillota bacterium]MBQ9871022.1 TetR/AcrR family transcriptional regulator [Eubacterium sp.]
MNFTDLRILKTQERLQNALLELLDTKELKEITVKEICDKAGISRNAFYQHYGYKEDLYDQMVARATEGIRDSLMPIIQDASAVNDKTIASYAKHIVEGVSEVRELIYVMLKRDDGIFLRQLTDLIFGQNLTNALSFFDMKDSAELRLYYEFQSAGMAAFIIKWILDEGLSEEKAAELFARILLQSPGKKPIID